MLVILLHQLRRNEYGLSPSEINMDRSLLRGGGRLWSLMKVHLEQTLLVWEGEARSVYFDNTDRAEYSQDPEAPRTRESLMRRRPQRPATHTVMLVGGR